MLALLSGCSEKPQRAVLTGATMGTTWSVVYGDPETVSAAELQTRIEEELTQINAAFSTYIADSEVSSLNAQPGGGAVVLSPRFAEVLTAALAVGDLTDGAYDITVGPLIELWGFGSREFSGEVPAAERIADARSLVGSKQMRWNPADRTLERPEGMRIDLSSIAKGYAVDRLSVLLADAGLRNTLVEIGGELRATGERPEGGPWRLAIESPDPSAGRFVDALALENGAVATSGDYRNFFEVEGRRYSHLVDPRTGYPVSHELVSVTVVHENCMTADALATALIVMGRGEAQALAEAEGLAAQFVSREGDGLEVHYTDEFAAFRAVATE